MPRVCVFPQVHWLPSSELGAQGLHHPHQGADHIITISKDFITIILITIILIIPNPLQKTRKTEMVMKYDGEQEDVVTFPRHTHKVVFLFIFCGIVSTTKLPNQMISLILIFGCLFRSSIYNLYHLYIYLYFQIQVTEKYSTAMCYVWTHQVVTVMTVFSISQAVTLRLHQECDVRDPNPHIHRRVIEYPAGM